MTALTPADRRLMASVVDAIANARKLDDRLAAVATPLVAAFADICLVDRRYPRGKVDRLTAVHADPSRNEFVKEVRLRYPPTSRHPVMDVLRSGRPVFERLISDGTLRRMARDESHFEILKTKGPKSSIRLPIVLRGDTIAVITLSLTGHRRTAKPRLFSAHDFEVAKEVARLVSAQLEAGS